MATTVTTTSSQATDHGVKALVYSKSGVGKTVLCCTCPGPLIISAENGLLSLQKDNIERIHGVNTPGICYDIPVVTIENFDDLNAVYHWIVSDPSWGSFKTICLDSISEIAEKVLVNAKLNVKDPRQAYGKLLEDVLDIIKKFRDLPGRNVLFLGKMEPFKDEMTGITKYSVAMPGTKLTPQVPYLFDFVFKLDVGKTPEGQEFRYLLTQPDMQNEAKDRSGRLNPVEVPHFGVLLQKLNS